VHIYLCGGGAALNNIIVAVQDAGFAIKDIIERCNLDELTDAQLVLALEGLQKAEAELFFILGPVICPGPSEASKSQPEEPWQ
jgi:hypothetical protein